MMRRAIGTIALLLVAGALAAGIWLVKRAPSAASTIPTFTSKSQSQDDSQTTTSNRPDKHDGQETGHHDSAALVGSSVERGGQPLTESHGKSAATHVQKRPLETTSKPRATDTVFKPSPVQRKRIDWKSVQEAAEADASRIFAVKKPATPAAVAVAQTPTPQPDPTKKAEVPAAQNQVGTPPAPKSDESDNQVYKKLDEERSDLLNKLSKIESLSGGN